MHRNSLVDLLERYSLLAKEENATVVKFQKFIADHEDCFERSCAPGHITGSSWIVDESQKFTLLTHHRKLGKWFQLGGHADGLSNVFFVAMKEAKEESGLQKISALSEEIFDIDVHLIPDKSGGHYHYDVRFLFQADISEKLIVSNESKDLAWVSLDLLDNFSQEPSVLRMRKKIQQMSAIQ